jgi:hypothetical protein
VFCPHVCVFQPTVSISPYSLKATLFALENARTYCRVGIEFLSIMEMRCRLHDKSIGVIPGFFGLGVNGELSQLLYIVLKSYSSRKANAKISQRHCLLNTRPSTFTLATCQHCTPSLSAFSSRTSGTTPEKLQSRHVRSNV